MLNIAPPVPPVAGYVLPREVTVVRRTKKFSDWADCSGCPGPGQAVRWIRAEAHKAWHAREGGAPAPAPTPTPAPTPAPTPTPTDGLPFLLPAPDVLRPQGGKVFAHYWPPLPISIDNADPAADFYATRYLNPTSNYPTGASAYGGYLRDRPVKRSPRAAGSVGGVPSWRIEDAQEDVRRAISGGLDGFALDMIVFPGGSDTNQVLTQRALCRAAPLVDPGFKVMLMMDMNGAWANFGYITEAGAADFIAELAGLLGPCAYTVGGKLVISTFRADAKAPTWYASLFGALKARHGLDVTFIPAFLSDSSANRTAFASISYGMGFWGDRNPRHTLGSNPARVEAIRAMGKKVFYPVSIQDFRPRFKIYDEARGTEQLRTTWQIARDKQVEYVQLVTWNDYTENTSLSPSQRGRGWLDLNAYFLAWFKTGSAPKVTRDALYLVHRQHAYSLTAGETLPATLRTGSTPATDEVEVVSFLSAPDTVRLPNGLTVSAPAGFSVHRCPLAVGTLTSSTGRGVRVESPFPVSATPKVQDMTYVCVSSLR